MLIIINNRVYMCVYKLTINFKVVIIVVRSEGLTSHDSLDLVQLALLIYLYK